MVPLCNHYSWHRTPSLIMGFMKMRNVMECFNKRCTENLIWDSVGTKCPACGTTDIENHRMPDDAKDIGILRADYNRRNMHKPGFVPSVAYDKNGNPIVN